MSEAPLVSVCVPTYNYGRFLTDCIESVLEQGLSDWELVIVDDRSTDETREIAQSYAKRDTRIRYVLNERRLGMNANIKRATELGAGKYLKPLCADDWLCPSYLERLVDLLERHPNAAIATAATFTCNERGVPISVQFQFGERESVIDGDTMLDLAASGRGLGGNSSFLLRASAYRAAGGYDDGILYAADFDLAARMCKVGRYIHVDEPLFCGRLHGASSSSNDPAKLHDVRDAYAIPRKLFAERKRFNAAWRRYRRMHARATARHLLNVAVSRARGRHEYADALWRIVRDEGDLLPALPYLARELVVRAGRRILGNRADHADVAAYTPPGVSLAPTARGGIG